MNYSRKLYTRHLIAALYDALPVFDSHAIAAYDAFKAEVIEQYRHMVSVDGVNVVFTETDPYRNSKELFADIAKHNRLKVFVGGNSHPLLGEANNLFRAIHDYFGHYIFKHSFGPNGEENAWVRHSRMFSWNARRALTTETRGQNSWFNYFGNNPKLKPQQRQFPIQKVALLPDAFVAIPKGVI